MRRREATLDTLIVNENISSADQLYLREYTTASIKGHIAVGLSVPSKEIVTRLEVHLTDNQLISTISGYRSPSLAFHNTLATLERPKRTDVRVTALLSLLQYPRKTVHAWLSARTGRRGHAYPERTQLFVRGPREEAKIFFTWTPGYLLLPQNIPGTAL